MKLRSLTPPIDPSIAVSCVKQELVPNFPRPDQKHDVIVHYQIRVVFNRVWKVIWQLLIGFSLERFENETNC